MDRKPTLRSDGRYMLMVRVSPGPKGRIPAYGNTPQECLTDAANKLKAIREAREDSPALPNFPPESFGWFVYNIYVPHVYPKLKPASKRKYDTLIAVHLLPALAFTPIAEIGYHTAKTMMDTLKRQDGPKKTRGTMPLPDRQKTETVYRFREIMGLYRRLRVAETGQPVRDDWKLVEPPAKPEKKKRSTPSADFMPELFAVCDRHEQGLVYAAYGLMLRRGEIAALMKRHIDRDSLTLHIHEQAPERGGENVPTKGKPRDLPITKEILSQIDALSDPNSIYVFTDSKGRPWKPDAISKLIPKIIAREGLPHSTAHDLRSYATSDLIGDEGEAETTAQDLLGHTDLKTTRIYVNAADAPRRRALGKLQKRLTKGQTAVDDSLETTG